MVDKEDKGDKEAKSGKAAEAEAAHPAMAIPLGDGGAKLLIRGDGFELQLNEHISASVGPDGVHAKVGVYQIDVPQKDVEKAVAYFNERKDDIVEGLGKLGAWIAELVSRQTGVGDGIVGGERETQVERNVSAPAAALA